MNIGFLNANSLHMVNMQKNQSFRAGEVPAKKEEGRIRHKISDYDFAVTLGAPTFGALVGAILGQIHNCTDNITKLNKELLERVTVEADETSKYIKEVLKPLVKKADDEELRIFEEEKKVKAKVLNSCACTGLEREASEIKEAKDTLRDLQQKEIKKLSKLEAMKNLTANYKKQNLRTFAVVGLFTGMVAAAGLLVAKYKYNFVVKREEDGANQPKA